MSASGVAGARSSRDDSSAPPVDAKSPWTSGCPACSMVPVFEPPQEISNSAQQTNLVHLRLIRFSSPYVSTEPFYPVPHELANYVRGLNHRMRHACAPAAPGSVPEFFQPHTDSLCCSNSSLQPVPGRAPASQSHGAPTTARPSLHNPPFFLTISVVGMPRRVGHAVKDMHRDRVSGSVAVCRMWREPRRDRLDNDAVGCHGSCTG